MKKPSYSELEKRVKELEKAEKKRLTAEEALKKSEKEKQIVLESLTEIVLLQNVDHDILWANRAAGESVNKKIEEIIGHKCYEIWHGRKKPCEFCPVAHTIKTGEMAENEISSPDGREWLIRGYPVLNDEGILEGVVEATLDITSRKKAERGLILSEERYRELVQNSIFGIVVIGEDNTISMCNSKTEEICGYSKEELEGKMMWIDLVAEQDKDRLIGYHKSRIKGEYAPTEYEMEIVHKNGSGRDVYIHIGHYSSTDEWVVSLMDVTQRNKVERFHNVLFAITKAASTSVYLSELLRTVHLQIETLMYAKNFYVALVQDAENSLYTMPYFVDERDDDLDISKPMSLKNTFTDYVRKNEDPLLIDKERSKQAMDSGEFDVLGTLAESWMGVPLINRTGEAIGVISVQCYEFPDVYSVEDLNVLSFASSHIAMAIDKMTNDEKIRENEELFRSIFSDSPIGIQIYSTDGTQLVINNACYEIFGISPESSNEYNLLDDPNILTEILEDIKQGKVVKEILKYNFDLIKEQGQYETNRSGTVDIFVTVNHLGLKEDGSFDRYLVQIQEVSG